MTFRVAQRIVVTIRVAVQDSSRLYIHSSCSALIYNLIHCLSALDFSPGAVHRSQISRRCGRRRKSYKLVLHRLGRLLHRERVVNISRIGERSVRTWNRNRNDFDIFARSRRWLCALDGQRSLHAQYHVGGRFARAIARWRARVYSVLVRRPNIFHRQDSQLHCSGAGRSFFTSWLTGS